MNTQGHRYFWLSHATNFVIGLDLRVDGEHVACEDGFRIKLRGLETIL